MKKILPAFIIIFAGLLYSFLPVCRVRLQESKSENIGTEWLLSGMMKNVTEKLKIEGNPEVSACKYGQALSFNGKSDGIFLDTIPLSGKRQFTVEVIFQPQSGGNFEQRFLHIGEVQGNRLLLELRSVKNDWYLDAYIKSDTNQCTLINPSKLHPSDVWYNVACTLKNGKFITYVNGMKEEEGNMIFSPFEKGITSIGVRQNKTSWFKGSIYKLRISGKAIATEEFIKH